MILRILLSIVAVVFGFFFPSIFGAIVFALILVFVINGFKVKFFNMKRVGVSFVISFIAGLGLMWFFGLMGASETVHQKVDALKVELVNMGYEPQWFIICEKRNKFYNSWLPEAKTNSKHLIGMAIDLFVIDINGDNTYDEKDYKIISQADKIIQKQESKFKGKLNKYFGEGYFTSRMLHIQLD